MSNKKIEEGKELKENNKIENKQEQNDEIKESKQEEKAFPAEQSEQEEIEYLDSTASENPEICETEREKVDTEKREEIENREQVIEKLKEELKNQEKELAQLRNQFEELKDKFLRSLAELDNVRKRTEREKEEYFQYALIDLFREILPIIDNFERALKTPEDETDGKTFKEGVELIYRMLMNLLRKYGVRPIEITDKKFDPALHHALVSEESEEVSEPEIKEELQKGYLIHNRLLRPTMVKVVMPKKN